MAIEVSFYNLWRLLWFNRLACMVMIVAATVSLSVKLRSCDYAYRRQAMYFFWQYAEIKADGFRMGEGGSLIAVDGGSHDAQVESQVEIGSNPSSVSRDCNAAFHSSKEWVTEIDTCAFTDLAEGRGESDVGLPFAGGVWPSYPIREPQHYANLMQVCLIIWTWAKLVGMLSQWKTYVRDPQPEVSWNMQAWRQFGMFVFFTMQPSSMMTLVVNLEDSAASPSHIRGHGDEMVTTVSALTSFFGCILGTGLTCMDRKWGYTHPGQVNGCVGCWGCMTATGTFIAFGSLYGISVSLQFILVINFKFVLSWPTFAFSAHITFIKVLLLVLALLDVMSALHAVISLKRHSPSTKAVPSTTAVLGTTAVPSTTAMPSTTAVPAATA